ncbi:1187_t:CDS:2 [Diversispora eburnea]|uniref:1187_t:CDS:1 n=1 Tax=Diversispora eburnea TaxID=1213867 RepID=A0A9N9CEI0_9GLOM|nr:1187_t:CDS:2 [Diversispora eburnea]
MEPNRPTSSKVLQFCLIEYHQDLRISNPSPYDDYSNFVNTSIITIDDKIITPKLQKEEITGKDFSKITEEKLRGLKLHSGPLTRLIQICPRKSYLRESSHQCDFVFFILQISSSTAPQSDDFGGTYFAFGHNGDLDAVGTHIGNAPINVALMLPLTCTLPLYNLQIVVDSPQ